MNIPAVNLQAIAAIVFFVSAIAVSRITVNIYSGRYPSHPAVLFYLRVLLGFLLAGAIVLGYYSFAGIDVISSRW
jgi:hypothetical protein